MSDGLEERTLAALRDAGLLRPRRNWTALSIAAAVVVGFLAGALTPGLQRPPEREFLLLLRGDAGATTAAAVQERVREYRDWASRVDAPIDGEKLVETATILGNARDRGDRIGGFFRVAAPSLEEARAIASSCPHLRHGGWIEVREIAR
jgi:hypothetical protein